MIKLSSNWAQFLNIYRVYLPLGRDKLLSSIILNLKNVWCVARHVKNIIKRLTLAKILCWTFRQLLLPSSAGMKDAKVALQKNILKIK